MLSATKIQKTCYYVNIVVFDDVTGLKGLKEWQTSSEMLLCQSNFNLIHFNHLSLCGVKIKKTQIHMGSILSTSLSVSYQTKTEL